MIPVDGSGKGNVKENLVAFHISLFVMALQQSRVGLESTEGGEYMYCVCRALSVVSESVQIGKPARHASRAEIDILMAAKDRPSGPHCNVSWMCSYARQACKPFAEDSRREIAKMHDRCDLVRHRGLTKLCSDDLRRDS